MKNKKIKFTTIAKSVKEKMENKTISLMKVINNYSQAFGVADLFKEARPNKCCHSQESLQQHQQDQEKIRSDYEPATSPDGTQVNNGTGNRIC